jgi:hypothetical protein
MTAGHDEVRHLEQEQLTRLVDDAWRRHPSIEVNTELSSETRYDALLGAAQRSDLVVMGWRNDDHLLSRLGPVGSRLLRTSPCPTVIVGQPYAVDSDDLDVVAVNDIADISTLARLLRHDSTFGSVRPAKVSCISRPARSRWCPLAAPDPGSPRLRVIVSALDLRQLSRALRLWTSRWRSLTL